ncbi:helix-turn-helix domain-containing protein [Pseudooceanicola sp. CBS1P-1]|nr:MULTISPECIES: helix-turn-helix domain-containing protein [Pseudooceanicola]MBT9386322.1 helix-turn-helix domain-containing protein [Pseudooceanicola endophyticus]
MPDPDPKPMRILNAHDLGQAIRRRRKALGLTQEDVAAQVGIARITVGAIENGKETAHIGLVLQVCRDLGLPLMTEGPQG